MLELGEFSLKMLYGLGFMLSTLIVASFSDLRSMTIKRDFLIMWLGFVAIMFFHDYYSQIEFSWIKWGMIVFLSLLSWKRIGKIFSLERADVAAIAGICSTLPVSYILLFYVILILVNFVLKYPLKLIFGKGNIYPFIPVIWVSTIILVIILGIIKLF